MKLLGRKFIFAIIAIICVTITTIMLHYDAKSYIWLVGIITGIFTGTQAYTDAKKEIK